MADFKQYARLVALAVLGTVLTTIAIISLELSAAVNDSWSFVALPVGMLATVALMFRDFNRQKTRDVTHDQA